jgi:tetratricopeptide (TPR) repeat protein
LLDFFAYLPLAIKQAAAYMDQTGMSMKRYLELCRSSDRTFVTLHGKDFEDQGRYKGARNPVIATWLISFRQISRDNKLAAQILQFMSILAENIPRSVLPPGEDELEGEEAIGMLKAYAFIKGRAVQKSYEMHRLVRLAMRNWLTEQGKLKACVTAVIRRLNEVFPSPTHENRHAWEDYLPHALAALNFKDNSTEDAVKARLLGSVAESNQRLGKYKESEKIYRQALELQTKVLGNKHPDTLWSMRGVACALLSQGKYEQAEMIYRQTLELRTRVLGAEHSDTINIVNDLAFSLGRQGKLKQAERMHR